MKNLLENPQCIDKSRGSSRGPSRIPTVNNPSFSSSKKIDFQVGYERSVIALVAALSGGNMMYLHGAVHSELTYHPAMSVLDNDIVGWIGRFIEGVKVTDETLAIDL